MHRDPRFDSTLAFLRDPYGFVKKQCLRFGDDLFEARIMLQKTICMTGPEAARLFYSGERFMRRGAAPMRLQATLFGRGGVQTLDDAPHHNRKHMFMKLMTPERIEELAALCDEGWEISTRKWAAAPQVELYRESRELLCRAVCAWAGVPLPESEVATRTAELTALFESAGAVGPRHWSGRRARARAEHWAGGLIERIRAGQLKVPEETAAHVIATHLDYRGELLDSRTAAVELLNVLRPTIAVSVFMVFEALALHEFPENRQKLQENGADDYAGWFVQEVRRFYPFFPSVVALVRRDFEWKGHAFRAGRRVILDLHGTNHDPRAWEAPDQFRPERFAAYDGSAYTFIPQGGGEAATGHRCPGEWITIELMKRAARFLARSITYEVPQQNLDVDLARLPALPASRFMMSNIRPASGARAPPA